MTENVNGVIINDYISELLIYKLKDNKKNECIDILNIITKDMLNCDINISRKNLINVIYLSIILNEEQKIVKRIDGFETFINQQDKEISLFKEYKNIIAEIYHLNKVTNLIEVIKLHKPVYLDATIFEMSKVIMLKKLSSIKPSSIKTKKTQVSTSVKADEFYLIGMKKENCAIDNSKLKIEKIDLAYYKDKKCKTKLGVINIEAKICPACGMIFLNERECATVKTLIGGNFLKQSTSPNPKKQSISPNPKKKSRKISKIKPGRLTVDYYQTKLPVSSSANSGRRVGSTSGTNNYNGTMKYYIGSDGVVHRI